MKRLFLKAAGAAAAGAMLKACGGGGGGGGGNGGGGDPSGTQTLLQLLQDGRFSTLLAALQTAGVADQLGQGGTNYTLFAPTNDAFVTLNSRASGVSSSQLAAAAPFHVISELWLAARLRSIANTQTTPDTLYSYRGDFAKLIFVSDNGTTLNIWDGIGRTSIAVDEPDIAASNGVMHVVSDVMVPRGVLTVAQTLRASIDSFSKFATSMVNSGAIGAFSGSAVTVFVPDDSRADASALTNNQVLHHAVAGEIGSGSFSTRNLTPLSGGPLRLVKGAPDTINGTQITDVDFFASNGVIHVVGGILP